MLLRAKKSWALEPGNEAMQTPRAQKYTEHVLFLSV